MNGIHSSYLFISKYTFAFVEDKNDLCFEKYAH